MEKKVSVVIPTKNGGGVLKNVIDVVLGQITNFEFDLTIIDSGSTDGVIQEVASMNDSRIQIIKIASEEFGHGRTRNHAISQTSGQYIAMITQDATPSSNSWLQNLVIDIESDERIAGVFGRHLPYPQADIFTKRDFQMHFDSFRQEPLVWLQDKDRYQADDHYRQKLHFFSDNNALLRRSIWEQIPYPEVSFAEDQQWAKLVIEAGWRKKYSDEGSVFHSHNYRLIDLFRRSIDESRAMKEYFNYQLSPNLKNVLKSWVGFSIRDTKYVFHRKRSVPKNLLPLLSQYVRNFLKPLGHHIGNRYSEMPQGLVQFLSYDYRLRIGKRQGGGVAKSKSGI